MKFLRDLLDVVQFSGNFLSGSLVLLSFIFVPFLFPVYGIFLIRRGKKAFGKISGKQFFIASITLLLVWLYPFANGSEQYGWVAKFPLGEILMGYIRVLFSLAVFHFGVFFLFLKNNWMKFLGVILMLIGLYGFVLLLIGRVYSGT